MSLSCLDVNDFYIVSLNRSACDSIHLIHVHRVLQSRPNHVVCTISHHTTSRLVPTRKAKVMHNLTTLIT